jgi:hypothetical protein
VNVYLQCDCGNEVIVSEGMAGSSMSCECGRTLIVPGFAEMKRMAAGSGRLAKRQLGQGSVEEQVRLHPWAFGLGIGWIFLSGFPLLVLTLNDGRALAALGMVLWLGGLFWLFTLIFMGNPVAAFLTLVPVIGPFLIFRFLFDHWSIAKWPLLCHMTGVFLFLFDGGI